MKKRDDKLSMQAGGRILNDGREDAWPQVRPAERGGEA
jgi:hypothetical protein